MSFDRDALAAAIDRHGRVARVVIAAVKGSSPREVGASMLVWADGQSGTIGGGALEYAAAQTARTATERYRLSNHALGPDLGQCCGGAVRLVTEVYDAERLAEIPTSGHAARGLGPQPLSVTRALRQARAGHSIEAGLYDGWLIEPLHIRRTPLWVWGAGHVGRALIDVLHPLPDLALTWVDDAPTRYPEKTPAAVRILPSPHMQGAMALAPATAHHLILTYSHETDLALCHAALLHGFAKCGVIGSATKWARFRRRLRALGHSDTQIARIVCPIGDPRLGKHPQAIAIGVAQDLLRNAQPFDTQDHHHDRTASDA